MTREELSEKIEILRKKQYEISERKRRDDEEIKKLQKEIDDLILEFIKKGL